MVKWAIAFCGQGAQRLKMGVEFFQQYERAREMMERAEEALKLNLSKLINHGPEDELRLTRNQQPAVFVVNCAIYEVMRAGGFLLPDFGLGHSLGEYCANYAARAVDFEECVRLVRDRAQLMEDAVPAGIGGMCAIIGLSRDEVKSVCDEASTNEYKVWPANFNGAGQIVVSGHAQAVERAAAVAKERGARAIMLKVSGPFHTPLMQPAAGKFEDRVKAVNFEPPAFGVISNVNAQPNSDSLKIPELLVKQLTSPVLWEDSIKFLGSEHVEVLIEVCPAKILGPLAERTTKAMKVFSISTPKEMEDTWDKIHHLT